MTAIALVSLPLALGGALEWSLWLLVALSVLATTTWLVGAVAHRRRWAWHPALLLPLMVALLEVIQLVPLPPSLLQLLSPVQPTCARRRCCR